MTPDKDAVAALRARLGVPEPPLRPVDAATRARMIAAAPSPRRRPETSSGVPGERRATAGTPPGGRRVTTGAPQKPGYRSTEAVSGSIGLLCLMLSTMEHLSPGMVGKNGAWLVGIAGAGFIVFQVSKRLGRGDILPWWRWLR